MLRKLFTALLLYLFLGVNAQDSITYPPLEDYLKNIEYKHQSVDFQDFAQKADGYWLFEPAAPKPDSAHVVVFVHGYGGYNPLIYGKWIEHLVLQGNIVIYPRYQKNLYAPRPRQFSKNVSQAINDALLELEKPRHVRPIIDYLTFVGHSYGGVISGDLACNFEEHNIPEPRAVMMVSPGTGWMKEGRLESYEKMQEDLKLLIVVSDDDLTCGDGFGKLVFNTATKVKQRNLLRQFADHHGKPHLTAGHNMSYCVDNQFDTGVRNYTAKKALRMSTLNPIDYFGYWRLFDALLDCVKNGKNCTLAFGNTPEQKSLGNWSDGTPIRPFEVTLPPSPTSSDNSNKELSKSKNSIKE